MTTSIKDLENSFLNAYESNFADRIKLRKAYGDAPSDMTLIGYLRSTGADEQRIEATLNAMGIVTDPHDPNATDDPVDAAARYGTPRSYRPPTDTPAPPVQMVTTRVNSIASTLVDMGVQLEPFEMTLANVELELLKAGRITEDHVADAYARTRNLPRIDLKRNPPDPAVRDELPDRYVIDNEVIPYRNGPDGTLVCVTSTLRTAFIGPRIEDRVHRRVEFVITTASDLRSYIDRVYNQSATFNTLQQESQRRARTRPEERAEQDTDDSMMAQTFATIMREAVRQNASDIHIQPTKTDTRVRMRVDGVLREINRIPADLHRQFTNYIRVKGAVSNTRDVKPLDTQIETEVNGRTLNIRVNITPTLFGSKTVMRILSTPDQIRPLADLGLTPRNWELLTWGMNHQNGILVISGPTGSGKTNTLYSMVSALDTEDVNITTIENPVEIRMDSIAQIQVNPDALNEDMRLTAVEALRAVLRQDPDIILVGEMRDRDTVQLGVQAAQTGHLVLATTHANSAAESITRLSDLGADPFDLAPSLRLLMAQRLIRRPCPECTTLQPAPAGTFTGTDIPEGTAVPTTNPERQKDCRHCGGHGHVGRVAIMEILPVMGAVREAIRNKTNERDVVALARQYGFRTLHEDALVKLSQGLTTLEEVSKQGQGAQDD